jgi:hypothetical protein
MNTIITCQYEHNLHVSVWTQSSNVSMNTIIKCQYKHKHQMSVWTQSSRVSMNTIITRAKFQDVVCYNYVSNGTLWSNKFRLTESNSFKTTWHLRTGLCTALKYTLTNHPSVALRMMHAGSSFMLLEVGTATFCVFSAIPSGRSLINTSYSAELYIFPQSRQFPHI